MLEKAGFYAVVWNVFSKRSGELSTSCLMSVRKCSGQFRVCLELDESSLL